ncbi:MAG: prepilin-type N-terminal cleavage/methylation domain-containing protein [Firmicutes bacterium]|nr:prepilin-type N-terminal cleavage/methylation domain-containing protein [Bacillota bacterium]
MKKHTGFTFVEVMVSMVIMGISLMAAFSFFVRSMNLLYKWAEEARELDIAVSSLENARMGNPMPGTSQRFSYKTLDGTGMVASLCVNSELCEGAFDTPKFPLPRYTWNYPGAYDYFYDSTGNVPVSYNPGQVISGYTYFHGTGKFKYGGPPPVIHGADGFFNPSGGAPIPIHGIPGLEMEQATKGVVNIVWYIAVWPVTQAQLDELKIDNFTNMGYGGDTSWMTAEKGHGAGIYLGGDGIYWNDFDSFKTKVRNMMRDNPDMRALEFCTELADTTAISWAGQYELLQN